MRSTLAFKGLNKQVDGLSNLFSLMKLNFPIIGLNTTINSISLPDYPFFFIKEKYLTK